MAGVYEIRAEPQPRGGSSAAGFKYGFSLHAVVHRLHIFLVNYIEKRCHTVPVQKTVLDPQRLFCRYSEVRHQVAEGIERPVEAPRFGTLLACNKRVNLRKKKNAALQLRLMPECVHEDGGGIAGPYHARSVPCYRDEVFISSSARLFYWASFSRGRLGEHAVPRKE